MKRSVGYRETTVIDGRYKWALWRLARVKLVIAGSQTVIHPFNKYELNTSCMPETTLTLAIQKWTIQSHCSQKLNLMGKPDVTGK